MILLSNGKVALQASNGKYLSRIAYSNDATDDRNRIQPVKDSIDYFSQFDLDYPTGSPFENVDTITLRAENGRYLAPHGGTTIKPVSTIAHRFILFIAKSEAKAEFVYTI